MHKAVKLNVRDDDDAAIGIGTLIVFIALVLVAAIAAAVIIQTAYSLKDQAEATAAGARNEVAGSIKVMSVIGDRDPTGSGTNEATIDVNWLYISHWDSSRGIDMSTVSELFAPPFLPRSYRGELPVKYTGKMARAVYADSLKYLPIEALARAIGLPEDQLCLACLNHHYPTAAGQRLYRRALRRVQGS